MKKNILTIGALALTTFGICHAEDIHIRFNGATAQIEQQTTDSVLVTADGAHVSISSSYQAHQLTIRLSGTSEDGQLILQTDGKTALTLDNLHLTSQEGAPLWLRNKKRADIIAADGTQNTVTIAACVDTANHKSAAIWSKDKLKFTGTGTLNVLATGDGCKGIRAKKDITVEQLTLNVETTGNNLGKKENAFGGGFGAPPMGGFGGGMPDFNNLSEEEKARFEEMRKHFEEMMQGGGFPMGGFGGRDDRGGRGNREGRHHERGDSARHGFGGFGGFGPPPPGAGGEGGGMPFGKQKYKGTAKGIKTHGRFILNSGTLTVKTTSAGAEGIEGKQGIELNGGTVSVTAVDDAINANERIYLNGANVIAHSTTNDAIDANLVDFFAGGFPMGGFGGGQQDSDPAIIVNGGTIYAWSQRGMPEEGLDCDFSPIEVTDGTLFTVGAGMGEMPSVPTNETAQQPTALLIGIDIVANQPIQLCDSNGQVLHTVTVPFSLQRSSSLLTSPLLKTGAQYTVKTQGYEKTFTQTDPFTIVR